MRTAIALAFAGSLAVAFCREGHAQGVARCQELYVDASFDAARRCLETELVGLAERPQAIRDAYALLAATELAAEHGPAARRAAEVALAIDPAFRPNDPLLRAPRVLALFRLVGARPRPPVTGRGVFPQAVTLGDAREVRVTARVQGVLPPLEVALRHRARQGEVAEDFHESVLTGGDHAEAGLVTTVLRPPSEATAIEIEFVVRTPEQIPILRVPGPTLTRATPASAAPPESASPRAPRRAVSVSPAPRRVAPRAELAAAPAPRRTAPAAALTAPTRRARDEGGGLEVGVVALLSTAAVATAVVTALLASGELRPLFRIEL